jgi:hypothetical protein
LLGSCLLHLCTSSHTRLHLVAHLSLAHYIREIWPYSLPYILIHAPRLVPTHVFYPKLMSSLFLVTVILALSLGPASVCCAAWCLAVQFQVCLNAIGTVT